MRYTLDTPLNELELSVRTMNVLVQQGCTTLRDVSDKLDYLKKHARGFGSKGYRELKEVIMYASRTQGDLLEDTEYRNYMFEDRLNSVQALMSDVQNILLRAAIKGAISVERRRDAAFKLRDAAAYIDQLPVFGEEL